MSELKSRLDALRQQSGQAAPKAGSAEAVARRVERLRCGGAEPRPASRGGPQPEVLARAVGGALASAGYVRLECFLAWGTRRGGLTLQPPQRPGHLPGAEGGPGQWAFVDTETSGLAGGTGTVPFLCGFARVEAEGLRLCQFLLGGFGAEAAMLRDWGAAIAPGATLVSYNGKSFDLPLLRDRLRLHGSRHGLSEAGHLDLLHPVRRAFGGRWPDCRLATLERSLLGYRRIDDLPGSAVPEVWFAYLHRGETARMADVVRHNRDDLISLVMAVAQLDAVYADPAPHGADVRQVALAHERAGERDRAFALLDAAAAAGSLCDAGRLELAEHLRRRGDWGRACGIWEDQAARGCSHSLERLAKYHEHVRRDWHRALGFASRLPAGAARGQRLARLQSKLLS